MNAMSLRLYRGGVHDSSLLKESPSRLLTLDCFALASDVTGSVTPCLLVLLSIDDEGLTG